MEASGHPDLVHIGRVLRDRMDRTLEAEMEAARTAARRTQSLRDLLLGAEDGAYPVCLTSSDGLIHAGVVTAVGSDHVELRTAASRRTVVLGHVVTLEVRR